MLLLQKCESLHSYIYHMNSDRPMLSYLTPAVSRDGKVCGVQSEEGEIEEM